MKSQKVLEIPKQYCGSMIIPKHSLKLELAMRNFITTIGGYYYDDELSNGIISSYFELNNGLCIEQKIQIRQKDYIVHTILSKFIRHNDHKTILEFVLAVNSINKELDYGNFEIDVDSGEIRYRTYYEPGNVVDYNALDKLLSYPMEMVIKYGQVFL